jgi:hypothetical protein
VVQGVAGGCFNRADVELAIIFEQRRQRQMVAAVDTFLINPDVGFSADLVDLAQEIAFLAGSENPPRVDLGKSYGSDGRRRAVRERLI